MTTFDQLISHRFRGFSEVENSMAGLEAALDFGVQYVEFDIRVSACGTPVIYHDEYAKDRKGQKRHISQLMAGDFSDMGGAFAHIPLAEDLLRMTARHSNKQAKLLIDIKDYGFETEIDALVRSHRLEGRVIYVSWLPAVLYRMAELAPNIPLCLSYWPQDPDAAVQALHHVYKAKDGILPKPAKNYSHGERSGWVITGGVQGTMRDILKRCHGMVCMPHTMLSRPLIHAYQADGIKVSSFAYTDPDLLERHAAHYKPDLYFIDNRQLFEIYRSR